jgi:hypothetical protein
MKYDNLTQILKSLSLMDAFEATSERISKNEIKITWAFNVNSKSEDSLIISHKFKYDSTHLRLELNKLEFGPEISDELIPIVFELCYTEMLRVLLDHNYSEMANIIIRNRGAIARKVGII